MQPTIEIIKDNNGNTLSETPYVNGKKHGTLKQWAYGSPTPNSKTSYVCGEKHGVNFWQGYIGPIWYFNLFRYDQQQISLRLDSEIDLKINNLFNQDKLQAPLFSKSQFKKLCSRK